MSSVTMLNSRQAEPVTLGLLTLWCEEFTAAAVRELSEASTVSGENAVTNTYARYARITLKGRAFCEEAPMYHAVELDRMLRRGYGVNVSYRGMTMRNCRVQSYTVSDKGRSELAVSVVLAAEYLEEEEG